MNRSLRCKNTSLAPMDDFEVVSPDTLHWWQGRIPVEWVLMFRLIDLWNTLLWRTGCLTWWEECDLVGGLSLPLGQTHWKICLLQKKAVEYFWGVHFYSAMVEGRSVDSNVNCFSSFSGNLFTVLVYYLEVGDVSLRMVVANAVLHKTAMVTPLSQCLPLKKWYTAGRERWKERNNWVEKW